VVIVPQGATDAAGTPVLRFVTFDTEIGRFLVAGGDRGLTTVCFAEDLDVERALSAEMRGTRVVAVEDRIRLRRVVDDIRDYLGGKRVRFTHRVDLEGVTDFNRDVLEVVRGIPYGSLRSYKWVANEIGSPRATRPVGQALSHNPLPVIIPCHRVVNSDGTLGGYSGGGTDMKRRLIEIETGQTGLALGRGERADRDRILFLLESEGEGGDS
jgi:methylated-DNA-[protein]-cysteine S-methyltransferase